MTGRLKLRCHTCLIVATYADTAKCRRCTLLADGWAVRWRRVPFGRIEAWAKGDHDRLFESAWSLYLREQQSALPPVLMGDTQ